MPPGHIRIQMLHNELEYTHTKFSYLGYSCSGCQQCESLYQCVVNSDVTKVFSQSKLIQIGTDHNKCYKSGKCNPESLLVRSQYSEGPATGHLDKGFSWFPCIYKQMLRWFPKFQVATTCFSCSPPDLNLLITNFIFCMHVK